MENVLFKIPGIMLGSSGNNFKKRNFKSAVELMLMHNDNKLFYVENREFLKSGAYIDVAMPYGCPVIVFGEIVSYNEVFNLMKKNAKLIMPDVFSSRKQKYVYNERLNKIDNWQDTDTVVSEMVIPQILEDGEMRVSRKKDTFIFHDKAFILGNGQVDLSNMLLNLDDAVIEFRNNLDSYSFIKVVNLDYLSDGTIVSSEDKYIFRSDCHMNIQEALLATGNKENILRLVEKGQRDFIYDKKYDSVIPAPVNSYFVNIIDILRWKA